MNKTSYTDVQIDALIHDIIRQMNNDTWKPDYIVGLTRGGLVPALKISHYLSISRVDQKRLAKLLSTRRTFMGNSVEQQRSLCGAS